MTASFDLGRTRDTIQLRVPAALRADPSGEPEQTPAPQPQPPAPAPAPAERKEAGTAISTCCARWHWPA